MKSGPLPLALTVAVACTLACRSPAPPTLYMLADVDVESLDPHASGGRFASLNILANTYEGLVSRDADMRLQPGLASSWSNPDDHTWEFVLREGVRFHDGSILDADAAVASIRRAQQHPRSVVKGDLANVSEVISPAPGHVRIRTREPDAALLSLLPEVLVMSGFRAHDLSDVMHGSFGTGPYRVGTRRPGISVELTPFDGYRGAAAPFPRVIVLPLTYGSAEADAQVPKGAPLVFFAVPGTPAFERAGKEHVLRERTGLPVQFLGFDLRARETPGVRLPGGRRGNPFRDVRVRRAVALAIDYVGLRRSVLGGRTRPATQGIPPEVVGYDPSLPEPRRNLDEARALMAASGHPGGFEVDLDLREFVGQQFAPHLVTALAEIGIKATVRASKDQEFFDRLRGGQSSLFLLRFSCRTGDAQEYLDKFIHSRDAEKGYGVFTFSYDTSPDPEVDRMIEEARRTLDPSRRVGRLQAVMRRLMRDQVVVPLLGEPNTNFVSRGVAWRPRADAFRLFAEMRPVP